MKGNFSLANPVHLSRFLRYKAGVSVSEIAKQDRVNEDTVQESVNAVQAQEYLNSASHLEVLTIDTLRECGQLERRALKRALDAKIVIRHPETMKKVGVEHDHQTQLEASERLNDMREAVFQRHKPGPGGVNVGVAVNVGTAAAKQGKSFEERLRHVTARREGKDLPAPKGELPPGDVIDVQPDADSA